MKTSKNSSSRQNSSTEVSSAAPKAKASKVAKAKQEAAATVEPAAKEDGWQKAQDLAANDAGKLLLAKALLHEQRPLTEVMGLKGQKPAKAPKAPKAPKAAKGDDDAETGDRLPGNLEELKAAKGGLVASLFLAGKDKEAIAAELKRAFNLEDGHAAKIVRRITGRVRLFRRIFELHGLMAAK